MRTVRPFDPADLPAVREIMEGSLELDSIPGFVPSDIHRALVRVPGDPGGTVVALEDDRVVGYCTPHHDDLTVHPAYRRLGHGRRLVGAALALQAARGASDLVLYVPSHLPASQAFARTLGFRYRSSLWQFVLPADASVPPPVFPSDVTTRPWDRNEDVDEWVRFVTAAFEGHPTPMHLSSEVVRHVNAEPGFDPESILIVSACDAPDVPIGFARVEVLRDLEEGLVAYVNLVGVLPAWRGRGLGRELLRWAVGYLRTHGADTVQLSVEAANERATDLYRRHGFRPGIEWPHWSLPVG
jgi:mycothiol synthase